MRMLFMAGLQYLPALKQTEPHFELESSASVRMLLSNNKLSLLAHVKVTLVGHLICVELDSFYAD